MGFLDATDWKRVQDSVPITCVDILPIRRFADGRLDKIGLIHRPTPHQGVRWCVVGGRLWRNESIAEAITRQFRETLGVGVRFHLDPDPQPAYVSQYFTFERPIGNVDPRQHAVTLNFCVAIEGDPVAQGEANAFTWFDPGKLPPRTEFGFAQDRVVEGILRSAYPDVRAFNE